VVETAVPGKVEPSSPADPIQALVARSGVSVVAIVDDAFDLPRREDLVDAVEAFWDELERNSPLMDAFHAVLPNINNADELGDGEIQTLWAKRADLAELRDPLARLFTTRLANLSPVETLVGHLEALGIRTIQLGSDDAFPAPIPRLVFLDYFLGPSDSPDATKVSERRAKELYAQATGEKPMVILMSSKPEGERSSDVFRNSAGLLGALFGYIPKDSLQTREYVRLHLVTSLMPLQTRHTLQRFSEAIERAAAEATKNLVLKTRSLRLEDFVQIQWLSLKDEGQPVGDYLLWLYKAFYGHKLHGHTDVLAAQAELDKSTLDEFVPSQERPSFELTELYTYALTEPAVGKVEPHPHTSGQETHIALQLGDVFVKRNTREVLVVVNPACDLAFSPKVDKRPFPASRTILLQHGKLVGFGEPTLGGGCVTELFEHESKPFKLVWDAKQLSTCSYGEAKKWLEDGQWDRVARLCPSYAMEIQQAFAGNLSRVGNPVAPPSGRYAEVEVFSADTEGKPQLRKRDAVGVFVVRRPGRTEEEFGFTVHCAGVILGVIEDMVAVLEKGQTQPTALPLQQPSVQGLDGRPATPANRTERTLEKTRAFAGDSVTWLKVLQSLHKLPAEGKHLDLAPGFLRILRKDPMPEKYDKQWPPVVLNLKFSDSGAPSKETGDAGVNPQVHDASPQAT